MKVIEWPDKAKNPIGQVIDILGKAGDNTTEMHAILAEFGLPYVYPSSVEKAADKIPAEISDEEIAKREDFRNVTTFTIDPKDAKDFDDALSIRKLKDGLWEVGVHIADVTHYVTEGSIIDKEAEKRATSVYLVDRTIPMLPERLCNFICSLRPDEEKLAYSIIFNINEKGDVKDSRVVHTVIKSDRRFTYEEAQQIIETKEGDFKEEILMLDTIAKALRQKRFVAGAINFDRYEVKFEIDEKGKPISVYFKISKDANKLVEEFMLLANRTVAEKSVAYRKTRRPRYSLTVSTTFQTRRNWITWHNSSPASATRYVPVGPRQMFPNPSIICWTIFRARRKRILLKPYPSVPCRKHVIPRTTLDIMDWHSNTIHISPHPSVVSRT